MGIYYLGTCNTQETGSNEETLECGLSVTELDTINVQDRLAVGRDQSVQGQDFEHLQCGDQSAASLFDNVIHWEGIIRSRMKLIHSHLRRSTVQSSSLYLPQAIDEDLLVKGAAILASPNLTIEICSSSISRNMD